MAAPIIGIKDQKFRALNSCSGRVDPSAKIVTTIVQTGVFDDETVVPHHLDVSVLEPSKPNKVVN